MSHPRITVRVSPTNHLKVVVRRSGIGANQATFWSMGGEKETILASGNYMKTIAQTGQYNFTHSTLSI